MAEFEKALDGEKIQEMSTKDDEESVGAVKTVACEMLLQHRVELKFKNRKVTSSKKGSLSIYLGFFYPSILLQADGVLNRIHVTKPEARDNKARPAFIPAKVLEIRERKKAGMDVDEEDEEDENDMDEDDEDMVVPGMREDTVIRYSYFCWPSEATHIVLPINSKTIQLLFVN